MVNLFDPPEKRDLPVSLGGDIIIDFKNRVPGSDPASYTDYPAGWVVKLAIGKAPEIEVEAVITGHHAVCRIESEQADLIKAGWLWRVVVSIPDNDLTDDIVAMNGKVVRADGAT